MPRHLGACAARSGAGRPGDGRRGLGPGSRSRAAECPGCPAAAPRRELQVQPLCTCFCSSEPAWREISGRTQPQPRWGEVAQRRRVLGSLVREARGELEGCLVREARGELEGSRADAAVLAELGLRTGR